MFVVRIENDEATMYRAFRNLQTASTFADGHVTPDHESVVQIFGTQASEPAAAVRAVRAGDARLVTPLRRQREMPLLAGVLASLGFGVRATA